MKRCFFAVSFLIFVAAWCCGQINFARGEDLFMRDKPDEAAVYLENTIAENPDEVKAFLYLGIVYEQLDRAGDAITVYQQVLNRAGDLTANVANNLGNVYFKNGSDAEAESSYTRALEADQAFAPAYLGRANARLKTGSMRGAVADYEQYLLLAPDTPQREAIERLVAHVREEIPETELRLLDAADMSEDPSEEYEGGFE
jgi:tetratricopeptide (TPR) repeat protein